MLIRGKSAWKVLLYFCNVFISLKVFKNNMKKLKKYNKEAVNFDSQNSTNIKVFLISALPYI